MRIHAPEITRTNGNVRVSARIETEARLPHLPETLWYKFPEEFEGMIFHGLEPFLIPLVPCAMNIVEAIDVPGDISPRLLFHLERYQQMYHYWEPRSFAPIPIRHAGSRGSDPLVNPARAKPVGMMFSGGVDSFHTLHRNLPGNQPVPEYQITHGIYLFGFDLQEHERASYAKSLARYQRLFADLHLTLIPLEFNARQFWRGGTQLENRHWQAKTFGAGLAGAGHVLGGGLGKLYMASSQLFNHGEFMGSEMRLDQSLSTEWLEIIHDGLVEDRTRKTVALADWPATYDALRVCWWNPDGVQNCGQCPKCVRTMTTLEALGKLGHYSVFPKPYRPRLILQRLATIAGSAYLRDMRAIARKNGRWDLVIPLWIAGWIANIRAALKRFARVFNPAFEGW